MIGKLAVLVLPFAGLFIAIWYFRNRIPRVISIPVTVVAAIGCAWLIYMAIALSSVQCLGSCG